MAGVNKVAVVTGGGQGIGKAVAVRLLREGMRVILADADDEAGREAEAELQALGEVLFIPVDVAREEDVQRLMAEAEGRFQRLDLLVNNAGIAMYLDTPLEDLTLEMWHKVVSVNLTGQFLCAKYAAKLLRENHGCIVNIASTRALMSEPGNEPYAASKGGVVALTHALANSLGPEVRVNCISPGWIDVGEWKKGPIRKKTDLRDEDHRQHPVGRVGKPEDIASLVSWLASSEAGFVTGSNFVADGGMTRKMIYV